ncbi:MAG: hypothetical protein ABFD82_18410 [Syntrophaceae bacterium]
MRKEQMNQDDTPEIVFCRALNCIHNMGRGKCNIVHTINGDDKISINSEGVCDNFSIG